jgi:hypothetical protein
MNQGNWIVGIVGLIAVSTLATRALAAPGDVYKVTADRVHLRAGPSDDANVRSVVEPDQKLIELRHENGWIGVRVASTGEEGWIYSDLLKQTEQSGLGGGGGGPFEQFSRSFNKLMTKANDTVGYPLVDKVRRYGAQTLRITPTEKWLLEGSRGSHLMGTLSFYEMWKNHENDNPVTVVLLDRDNNPYITVKDTQNGPHVTVASRGQQAGQP